MTAPTAGPLQTHRMVLGWPLPAIALAVLLGSVGIAASAYDRIMRAVRKVDGVTKVTVDLRSETATVRREPALVSNAALAAAVADAGYEADLEAAEVLLPGADVTFLERLVDRWRGQRRPAV